MNLVPRKIFLDDFFDDFIPSIKVDTNMKCDIYEKDNKYFIEMDLPGFSKNDIKIDVDNEYLTIEVEKQEENKNEEKNYIRKERSYKKMSRSFYIGNVDEEMVKAEFQNGTLKVTIPKIEKELSKKRVEIE